MTDWNHIRRIRKHNLNGITIFGQVRGGTVLILTQAFSFKEIQRVLCFFSLPFSFPILTGAFSLYSPILLNSNLLPVDYVDDFLDVCPIRAFLENLCVAVRLNITVHASFPHKCG